MAEGLAGDRQVSLKDARLGLESGPGEPEVFAVDDWRELLASRWLVYRLAQDVQHTIRLVVDNVVAVEAEYERLARRFRSLLQH